MIKRKEGTQSQTRASSGLFPRPICTSWLELPCRCCLNLSPSRDCGMLEQALRVENTNRSEKLTTAIPQSSTIKTSFIAIPAPNTAVPCFVFNNIHIRKGQFICQEAENIRMVQFKQATWCMLFHSFALCFFMCIFKLLDCVEE